MGLIDNIRKITGGLGDKSPQSQTGFNQNTQPERPSVPAAIFGERAVRVEPQYIEPVESYQSYDDDSSYQNQNSNNNSVKELAGQISELLGIGKKEVKPTVNDADMTGLFSEEYLRNVANLRLSQLKIKYNLKVSLLKMSFSKMLEFVGKNDQAKNVWDTTVTINDMDKVITEIIYLDLKHQSMMGTLKPLTPDEFFAGMFTTAIEKMGGDGFENYIDLANGGFEKVKGYVNSKGKGKEVQA